MQNLGVIDNNFPNVKDTADRAAASTKIMNSFAHIGTEADAEGGIRPSSQNRWPPTNNDGGPNANPYLPNMKVTVMNVCTNRKTSLAYLDAAKKQN